MQYPPERVYIGVSHEAAGALVGAVDSTESLWDLDRKVVIPHFLEQRKAISERTVNLLEAAGALDSVR